MERMKTKKKKKHLEQQLEVLEMKCNNTQRDNENICLIKVWIHASG